MKKLLKYLILGIVDAVALFVFVLLRGIFNMTEPYQVYHILSDGCFLIGVLNFGIGGLIFVSNEGTFDILGYGLRSFWGFFFKGLNKYADFIDYKESKHKVKFPVFNFLGFGVLFITFAYLFLKSYQRY